MKNNFVNSLKLVKFSMSKRLNLVMMALFFVLGLTAEILENGSMIPYRNNTMPQIGAVFLLCTAMFPAQMAVSIDISTFAQTSAYKKRLQTSIQAKLLLVSTLIMFTLLLMIRMAGIWLAPGRTMESLHILPIGVFAAGIILYCGFVFKFFIAAIIVLYIAMMAIGSFYGYMESVGQTVLGAAAGNPIADVVLCYVLIIAAVGIEYLVSLAVYKFPLSKYAFRCSRSMND